MIHLKKALKNASGISSGLTGRVEQLLAEIASGREDAVRELAAKFDGWKQDLIIDADKLDALADSVDEQAKRDMQFAHAQATAFAKAQLASNREFVTKTC